MVLLFLKVMTKVIFFILSLFLYSNAYSESTVKAGDSLTWDSENKSYTANGSVEFSNDTFIAFSEKMIAKYVCLLYTSPSPRDLSTSRMPSSA